MCISGKLAFNQGIKSFGSMNRLTAFNQENPAYLDVQHTFEVFLEDLVSVAV